ncbi:MAG TPA: polyphosphate kinase 2, partial [Methylophilaceae bacterium]|nr:polyphosphate kinase 2 [Methylophilaceae bacterium]
MSQTNQDLIKRIHKDLIDSYDEELELELEDRGLEQIAGDEIAALSDEDKEYRRVYFRELFRLQG